MTFPAFFPARSLVAEVRSVSALAWPVAFSYFGQIVMATVETVAAARLGEVQLAGVALGDSLYLLFFLFALGMVTGAVPLASAALGRGDLAEAQSYSQQGFFLALAVSLPAVVLFLGISAIPWPGTATRADFAFMRQMAAGIAPALPVMVATVALRGVLLVSGNTRLLAMATFLCLPLHAALVCLLAFGALDVPGLGVFGIGFGFALSQAIALAGMIMAIRLSDQGEASRLLGGRWRFHRGRFAELCRMGLPLATRILLREGVMPAAALLIAPLGAAAVAGHAVALRVTELGGGISFGLGEAVSVRVGLAAGAGSLASAKSTISVSTALAAVFAAAAGLMIVVFKGPVTALLLGPGDGDAMANAVALMPYAALWLLALGLQSALGGALTGLQDAKGPLVIAALATWGFALPLAFVMAMAMAVPVTGIWTGLLCGEVLISTLYALRLGQQLRRHFPADSRRGA